MIWLASCARFFTEIFVQRRAFHKIQQNWPFRVTKLSIKLYLSKKKMWSLTLIREFLRPSPIAFSQEKSKNIVCDVTVRTRRIKIILCSEQIYMPFLTTEHDFRKTYPKHSTIYKWCNAALWKLWVHLMTYTLSRNFLLCLLVSIC